MDLYSKDIDNRLRTIEVNGNIGVGKTTFIKRLVSMFSSIDDMYVIVNYEKPDPIMLKKYLSNMKSPRHTLEFQLSMYNKRCEDTTKSDYVMRSYLSEHKNMRGVIIYDRGYRGDSCFVQTHINSKMIDYNEWHEIYSVPFSKFKIEPQIYIYLQGSTETCLARIKQRSRDGENVYNYDYIDMLRNIHETTFNKPDDITYDWDDDRDTKQIDKFITNNVLKLLDTKH